MLLLFNAVGLAMPASAAAEERVIPELGSVANLADAAVASRPARIESPVSALVGHSFAMVEVAANSPADIVASGGQPDWAVVAMRTDTGDKLEHEEGAP